MRLTSEVLDVVCRANGVKRKRVSRLVMHSVAESQGEGAMKRAYLARPYRPARELRETSAEGTGCEGAHRVACSLRIKCERVVCTT